MPDVLPGFGRDLQARRAHFQRRCTWLLTLSMAILISNRRTRIPTSSQGAQPLPPKAIPPYSAEPDAGVAYSRDVPDCKHGLRPARASGTTTRLLILMIAFCFGTHDAFAREEKTDLVVMMNGDRLVGEIKGLEFGQLEFKASYMASSVHLDWTRIKEMESNRRFRVEFGDGALYTGLIRKLGTPTPDGDFEVTEAIETTTRNFINVVSLEPLERSMWRRFRGSADVGFTLHPEAGQTQYSANASVSYPAKHYRIDSQASSLFSRQEGAEDSERNGLGISYTRFLSENWFFLGMTQILKDNQLNLDLRASFSGAGGRFLKHTNRAGLMVFGGIASTYEKYFDASSDQNGNKAEALAGVQFLRIRFASSQISTRLLAYAGLTEWGRERVDWDTSWSWEIWHNVFWKVSVLENFDNRPPEGAPRNDFAMTSSFGVSF
jgi:Protein of unknown function, DUF481